MPFGFSLFEKTMRTIFGMSINKFFAVLFSAMALLFLIAEFVASGAYYGFGAIMTFSGIWNYLLLLGCLLLLLIFNLRNDDRAYAGISLLIFFAAFDGFFGIGTSVEYVSYFAKNNQSVGMFIAFLSILFWIGQLGMGVVSYIFVARYRFGRTNNFKLVRLFVCLFLLSLVLTGICQVSMNAYAGFYSGYQPCLIDSFYYLCLIVGGASAFFTLNRLRRY